MTTMALDRFETGSVYETRRTRGSRRHRSRHDATPAHAGSVPVRAAVIDVRESDPGSSRLARIIMRPLVLAVMFTVAWQVGIAIGHIPL